MDCYSFAGFIRNYNMHNIRKTICELHDLLIKYEKGLFKKAATPQVMAIQDGRIQKANKKSQTAKGKGKGKGKGKDKPNYIPKPKIPKPSTKEHPTKDDICHHCKGVGHFSLLLTNCVVMIPMTLRLVFSHWLVMSPRTCKKFRWGTVFPTGRKRYTDPETGLRINQTKRKCRIPIDLYPCRVEEKLIMKELEGEWIMKKEIRMISKDGTISKFPGYTSSKKKEEGE
nr:zinc finger, CCHC-type [Tanacetum cinerariifolium]